LGIALVAIGLLGLATSAQILWAPGWPRSSSMDQAVDVAEDYLSRISSKDLAIDEIMEFNHNFYIVYYEKSTGIGAFEMIIDKPGIGGVMRMWMMGNGGIRPEQGPNMMWNTKYGMHGVDGGMMMGGGTPRPWNTSSPASITADEARNLAQQYLDRSLPGAETGDIHPFYGYYTVHVEKDGRTYGMLSVNAYTDQVWYHNWHGAYIQTKEMIGD